MIGIAKQVGYSETAFLRPLNDGWRIRYFSPEIEVPFCGHATIASGAALGDREGEGVYKLILNEAEISVKVTKSVNGRFAVALQSPETWSAAAPPEYVEDVLKLFNLTATKLDPNFPIRFAFAGAKHLIIVLKDRKTLAEMDYHFENAKALMLKESIVTISLLWPESDGVFHSRNAFASGGVFEDPATGAAAAALAGYLRDIDWQGKSRFEIIQGEDMGCPSRLQVEYTSKPGASVKVAGETRYISEKND
jgi:PhzF family phenazine biosynthesis protein